MTHGKGDRNGRAGLRNENKCKRKKDASARFTCSQYQFKYARECPFSRMNTAIFRTWIYFYPLFCLYSLMFGLPLLRHITTHALFCCRQQVHKNQLTHIHCYRCFFLVANHIDMFRTSHAIVGMQDVMMIGHLLSHITYYCVSAHSLFFAVFFPHVVRLTKP